ncbi:hypothetical protein NDU88_002504, partial [Pleurodeles waltl]
MAIVGVSPGRGLSCCHFIVGRSGGPSWTGTCPASPALMSPAGLLTEVPEGGPKPPQTARLVLLLLHFLAAV